MKIIAKSFENPRAAKISLQRDYYNDTIKMRTIGSDQNEHIKNVEWKKTVEINNDYYDLWQSKNAGDRYIAIPVDQFSIFLPIEPKKIDWYMLITEQEEKS